jgi:hypothetical protein
MGSEFARDWSRGSRLESQTLDSSGVVKKKDEALTDRLWKELDSRLRRRKNSGLLTVLIGFNGQQHDELLSNLRYLGVGKTKSMHNIKRLHDHLYQWSSFDVIVVNHDAFNDDFDAVDTLLEFRKKVPGKRVIIVSSMVRDDDFGTERNSICDVTLKAPGKLESLRICLSR